MSKKIDEETKDLLFNAMVNMREYFLKQKPYIKKYYKWRRVHSEILDSMNLYANAGNYDFINEISKIGNEILKETNGNDEILNFDLDFRNDVERNLFVELQVYKNHPKMLSITEKYIAKNKFRNKEKLKFLEAMYNSFI